MINKTDKEDILLVDDNPENLKVLASILKPEGYVIRLAMNGVKALESIKAKMPKLILLDAQMPKMDGYETCRELKKDEKLAKIPVIFISASSEVLDKVKAFEVGAVDYIEKPFHMDEVIARVGTHLTVRKQSEQLQEALTKINETQKRLIQSEKMAALGMLSAGIAHEINNPINFVNAGAAGIELDLIDLMRLLDMYDEIDLEKHFPNALKKIEDFKTEIDYHYIKDNIMITVNDIKTGAARTQEIINGLKRFSRGDSEIKYKVNINEEISSNIKIIQRVSKKRILFILDLQEDIEIFDGFPGQLNQLFMNLIMNAEQSIKSNGVIKIATFNKENGVEIMISDNGCGIPKELGDRIFDPFLTTKKVGEGTGLGLSISFGIVENHNGTITFSSEVDVGTVFSVYLPYK
jgi:signal transduction histidine kinase